MGGILSRPRRNRPSPRTDCHFSSRSSTRNNAVPSIRNRPRSNISYSVRNIMPSYLLNREHVNVSIRPWSDFRSSSPELPCTCIDSCDECPSTHDDSTPRTDCHFSSPQSPRDRSIRDCPPDIRGLYHPSGIVIASGAQAYRCHDHRRDMPSAPHLKDLVMELKHVHWHALGIQLDVPCDKLDKIDDDYRSSERKLSEVLSYWLLNDEDPSWHKICDALKRIGGFYRIVRQLTIKYCSLNVLCTLTSCQQQHACRSGETSATVPTCEVSEHVQVAIHNLRSDFGRRVTVIRSSLGNASVERIKSLLSELPAGEVKGQVGCLLTQRDNCRIVMGSTDILELFMNLSNIHAWDFLHPQLLEYLVQELGDDTTKKIMEEYISSLVRFRKTTKMRDLSGWLGNLPNDSLFQKLVVQLGDNWEDKTYEDFEVVRVSLLRRQIFVQSSLSLCGVLTGSIFVILSIPKDQLDVAAIKEALNVVSMRSVLVQSDITSIYAEELCLVRELDPSQ